MNIQISIEPELSAEVEQVLNFGQVVSNSGISEIKLGDLNTGIFGIRAIRSQSLQIELNYPDYLVRENNPNDQIPLDLQISYNNSGSNNASKTKILPNRMGNLIVGGSTVNDSGNFWRKLYLYVYGTIDVGDIPNGLYEADVTLFVSYD
tara:strand:- start:9743 stop:10189 length:447 start_codon:yes stop_codon:yes gene_type:complete